MSILKRKKILKQCFLNLSNLDSKKSADEFEFRDADTTVLVTAEEAKGFSDGKVAGAFAMAREQTKK